MKILQNFDLNFIKEKTQGYETLIRDIDTYAISGLLPQTGLTFDEIKEAVDVIAPKKKIIICWAMGLTQHKNAVDNIRELVNLLLLKGSIGKKELVLAQLEDIPMYREIAPWGFGKNPKMLF